MIVLGIDPGTATTGYGLIDVNKKNQIKSIEYGQIKTTSESLMHQRLFKIYNSIKHIVQVHKPEVIVIERLFFNTNAKTAIAVGQARGIFLLVAGEFDIPVFEYTALQAKMTITGYGRSEKNEVRLKIEELLKLDRKISPIDASDALAMAICHCLKMMG